MKFYMIKELYEKLPVKIKFLFLPLFVNILTENPVFKRTLKELEEYDQYNQEKQGEIQLEKLKVMLSYAQKHVPYYKELFQQIGFESESIKSVEEIKKIPILTKERVIELGSALYSNEDIKYYASYTGGSSGQAMKCLLDKDSYYKERAFFTHFLEPYGYNPKKSRIVSFYGHNKGEKYYFSPIKADIMISPFRLFKEECFEDIYQLIIDFKAEFIMGYASAITYLAKQCDKTGKTIKLKAVVFTSENWDKEDEKLVEHVFNCKVVSTYGHTERAVFGNVYDNNCIFNKMYGYTELIPTEIENEFQIACTGFLTKKMPLIRYLTDDVVHITEDGKYELIGHRKSDVYLIGKNGAKIFKGALTIHMSETRNVKAYQYVQNEIGKAELHIVQDDILTKYELERIQEYLKIRCENLLDVKIKIVEEVKRTPRGKYIWAINNIGME